LEKVNILLTLLLLVFISSCKPSKKETLDNIRLCLKAQNETAVLFNNRNPYLQKIVDAKKSGNLPLDKSNLTKIDSMTIKINVTAESYLKKLETEKSKYPDETLTNGVMDYLKSVKNFEKEFEIFLELIKDSIQGNEEDFSVTIKDLALGLNSETRKLNRTKTEFYEKYEISQMEIDSLVELIKK
tara:strand:+ start:71 stop:625 length:555 start_codon:yes stop_codon:yes gene_type:complete